MGRRSRTKGAHGERESIGLLRGHLSDATIQRNLEQSRSGGVDAVGLSLKGWHWRSNARSGHGWAHG